MFERILIKRKLSKNKLRKRLGVSNPTLLKYFRCPEKMDGDMRGRMAKELNITIEDIDNIVNGKMTFEQITIL